MQPSGEPAAEMYLPFAQSPHRSMVLVIRTTNPDSVVSAVRRDVQALDPNLPIYGVRTMENVISESVFTFRTNAFLSFVNVMVNRVVSTNILGSLPIPSPDDSAQIRFRQYVRSRVPRQRACTRHGVTRSAVRSLKSCEARITDHTDRREFW